MKVLHLLGWYFPESMGGTEVYVAELVTRQRAAGFDVAVAAPRRGIARAESYPWGEAAVLRYPIPEALSRDEAQGAVPVAGHSALAAWLRDHRPDVVHVHTISTGVGLAEIRAARDVGARVVFTAHLPSLGFLCQRGTLLRYGVEACDGIVDARRCAACLLQQAGVPISLAGPVARAGHALGSSAMRVPGRFGTLLAMPSLIEANRCRQDELFAIVDKFVVLNGRALQMVTANGAPADKVAINRLGVGFSLASGGTVTRPPALPIRAGFVGRIHRTKGVDLLARAVEALDPTVAFQMEILGPDGDSTLTRELREASARDPRIVLGPPVPRDQMASVLKRLDVLICPSMWFENGPTVALEAMAVGTPVVGSDLGAMPEFITDGVNGRIVRAGDWQALRDVFAQLAADPGILARWRQALPAPRTMDDVSQDYLTLYSELGGAA